MRTLACSIVLLLATRANAQPSEPAGASDTEALKGHVLVWHDAALYTAPSLDASAVHVAALGSRKAGVGHVVPMHVVAAQGAFVEVELADDAGCTWSRLSISDDIAKLHLFVRRADLAPVLVKPYERTFADGTRIALAPGTPVVPAAAGYAVSLLGHELEAEIPAASVGHAYTPERGKSLAVSDREYVVAGAARLGDRAVAFDGLRGSSSAVQGATALVTFEQRCLAVTVAAPAKSVHAVDDDRAELEASSSGLSSLGLRDGDYLPAKTPLASPSGRQIAYAAKPIYLMGTGVKTTCIARRIRLDAAVPGAPAADTTDDDSLRLCAPTTKVVHEKLRSARSANGTTSR